jgi:hypothetical protein
MDDMCNKRVTLATESATRYIAQCEHGTVHIVWDNLSLRLHPSDFVRVAGLIDDACSDMVDPLRPDTGFRLNIQGVLLVFSPRDMALLHKVTQLAVEQMSQWGANEIPLFDLSSMKAHCLPNVVSPCSLN